MSRVGLGQSELDPTVIEIRTMATDPAEPSVLQCSMTYEVFNMFTNTVVTDEYKYTVTKRVDGEGYIVQGRL